MTEHPVPGLLWRAPPSALPCCGTCRRNGVAGAVSGTAHDGTIPKNDRGLISREDVADHKRGKASGGGINQPEGSSKCERHRGLGQDTGVDREGKRRCCCEPGCSPITHRRTVNSHVHGSTCARCVVRGSCKYDLNDITRIAVPSRQSASEAVNSEPDVADPLPGFRPIGEPFSPDPPANGAPAVQVNGALLLGPYRVQNLLDGKTPASSQGKLLEQDVP
eukprot:1776425-Rhodomonas_salina.2